MKNLNKLTAVILSALTAAALLAGCGAVPAASSSAETETAAAQSAPETVDTAAEKATPDVEPAESAESTENTESQDQEAPAEESAPKLENLDRFEISCDDPYGPNGWMRYDEQGRLIEIDDVFDDGTAPAFVTALYINYDEEGKADVHFDRALAAEYEGTPGEMNVYDVETYEDGTIEFIDAGNGARWNMEFNEQGLPTYYMIAQENYGYLITYTEDENGQPQVDTVTCVLEHNTGHGEQTLGEETVYDDFGRVVTAELVYRA